MSDLDPAAILALIEELVRRWRAQGIEPGPGNSPEAIRDFERRMNAKLPADVVQYFQAVDGMWTPEGPDALVPQDEHLIRFCPLAEVETESKDEAWTAGYLVFADYSIWAHAYGIRVTGDSEVAVLARRTSIPVAATFTEFLAKYLYEPDALFP